jgi:hypothetical protein
MTFEESAEYTQAVQAERSNCRTDGGPDTATLAFRKRFDKPQRKWLWEAGVDETKCIALH